MAAFGKRKQVRQQLDLANGDRLDERRPSDRAYARDVEAEARISILGKLLKIGLNVQDKAGAMTESVMHLWCTCTAMIPPVVTMLICAVAGVHGMTMLVVCLGVLTTSSLVAVFVFRGARHARRHQQLAAEREPSERKETQRPVTRPKTTNNKRKTTHPSRRRKGVARAANQRRRRP